MTSTDDDYTPLQDGMDRFLHLAKTSGEDDPSYLHAISIVQQALSHKCIYAGFAELLALPNFCKALQSQSTSNSNDGPAALNTLELFAYGTVSDYMAAPAGTYLKLMDTQLHKLQQLSIIKHYSYTINDCNYANYTPHPQELSASKRNMVPFSTLQPALYNSTTDGEDKENPLQTQRRLEQLLIQLIDSSVISAKLDQKRKCLILLTNDTFGHCISRDINSTAQQEGGDDDVSTMIRQLESFQLRTHQWLLTLDHASRNAKIHRQTNAELWKDVDKYISNLNVKETVAAVAFAAGNSGGQGGSGNLDVEGSGQEYGKDHRRSKRSRGGALGAGGGFAERGFRSG